jgi:hypothetical protein
MTRLQFTNIVYTFTKHTDTQYAPYPIHDGHILEFQLHCDY